MQFIKIKHPFSTPQCTVSRVFPDFFTAILLFSSGETICERINRHIIPSPPPVRTAPMRRIGGTERAFSTLQCREPAIGPALFAFSPSPRARISMAEENKRQFTALFLRPPARGSPQSNSARRNGGRCSFCYLESIPEWRFRHV